MEQIWWERVPNACLFVNDIVDSLIEEKSVIVHHSDVLPWQDFFQTLVIESTRQQNASKTFERISDISDPGGYLLQEFCKAEKRAQYRPNKSHAEFFAEHDDIVLHERYLWIKLCSPEQFRAWSDFVSDYVRLRDRQKEPAVFILEWCGNAQNVRKKGVIPYSFDEYINEYDRMVFAMLASSSVHADIFLKNYLAELTSNVLKNDIELYAQCITNYQAFLKQPYQTARQCACDLLRSDGCTYHFEKTHSEVQDAVWLTQIRTIYPMLEQFRENFVRRHRKTIQEQLPFYGELYDDPSDVELGTLAHMARTGRLSLSDTEYKKLDAFKDARNKLSHLESLSLDEIKYLYR